MSSATFRERLASLIGEESVSAFSRRVGIGNTTIQNYLDGSLPRIDKAAQIANRTQTSITWLATGDGPRDSHTVLAHSPSGTQPEQGEASMLQVLRTEDLEAGALILIPRLNVRLSAGPGAVVQTEQAEGFCAFSEPYLRSIGVNPRSASLMQVRGRSQYPTLNDGEWVLVDTSVKSVMDDGLYAVGYGDSMLVKRVQMMRDGSILLASDNKVEGYADERVPRSELHELRIVGRVKQHLRLV